MIGAVLRETPSIVPAWAVAEVEFLDEAQSINQAVHELQALVAARVGRVVGVLQHPVRRVVSPALWRRIATTV